jgi:hydrogenase maturation protease
MPKTLLLGLGNDLLSDDAIGLRVAAALRERLAGHADIAVAETTEMGLSLLDIIAGFEALMLVDAVQTRLAAPGTVHEIEGDGIESLPPFAPHFLGIGEVIALGRKLGLPVPSRVRIFAIEVQDPFTVGTSLTPLLELALPAIAARIFAALDLPPPD